MCTPQGIIEKVGCLAFDEAVKAAIKAGKYVLNYTTNLEKLQAEMRSLEDRSEIIERKVGEANDRGEEVENAVLHWRANADGMKNDVQVLMAQSSVTGNISCFTCSSPNIKQRYKLSKEAEEKKADVQKLTQDSHFDEISHPRPPPLELEFRSKKNYVNFDSRTPVFNDIIKALKDPSVNIVGIHGLGGVGKTTLAEQVGKEMRDDGTFKQVPLVAVSKDLNVEEIQSKLADRLDFTLDVAVGEKGRASQLWNKFTDGEKYLVILDDIWKEVDIEAIGIPIKDGKTGCKVLLTSRNEDLMSKMEVDRSFPIAELLMPEAWTLFKKLTGNSIDESRTEMRSLAYEVCKKCKGLPVAINALGAALKNKPYPVWKNALDKLERYMITNIEGIDPSVWASLKLSYDVLWSSDAKSCFLLCCLYPEDFDIPIEDLMRHCVARRLFSPNPRTIDQARNAACTVVQSLKSASLLSYGNDENFVRIHDVIRDVGISIAFKEEAFLVDHGALQWPRNPINGPPYSAISLRLTKIKGLPNELTCPQLHTLIFFNNEQSHLEVPENFFSGMKQLVVLIVVRMQMGRLPSSLANLDGLGMLCLEHCELVDIAILGDLKNSLEVLSLRGSTIEALPQEIGHLTSLLLLDLRDCEKLNVIPQGVISKLTSLEELYLPDAFDQWEATEDNRRDTIIQKVTLEELRWSLSTGPLTTLHIHIPNVMLLPKEGLKFDNLKRFRISMGSKFKWDEEFPGTRVLKYKGSSLKKEFIPLVDKAEALYLSGIKGLKNVLDDRGVGNEFLDLKCLKVESCDDDVEYFIGEPKSSVRSHGLRPLRSLTKLVIGNCKLKYLFSPSSARELVNLEQLIVIQCEVMEAIVGFEGQKEENEVTFSKLKVLHLKELPNLKCFYAENGKTRTTMGSSFARVQPLFNEKVILPFLEDLEVESLDSIEEIWDKQSPSVNQETTSFGQLSYMTVSQCKKLMNLVPSNILPQLRNLQDLTVVHCPNVEFVVFKNKKGEAEAADDSTLIIPRLTHLRIGKMEKLKRFYSSSTTSNAQSLFNHQVAFPVLEEIHIWNVPMITDIWSQQPLLKPEKEVESFCKLQTIIVGDCHQLEYVLPSYMVPQLHNLLELKIAVCKELEVIVSKKLKEKEATNNDILVFPQLKTLELLSLDNLKCFCTGTDQLLFSHKVAFPALEDLDIDQLPHITEIWDKKPLSEPEQEIESFSKLETIFISNCHQLVYVLPSYMLPRLQNLQELRIGYCKEVEVIVSKELKEKEAADNDPIVFSQLKVVVFSKLPKLKSFYTGTQLIFSNKVAFPALEDLTVENVPKIKEIWDKQPLSEAEKEAISFYNLRRIDVQHCDQLVYVFPSSMLPQLQNLQKLVITNCKEMEVIISNKLKEKEATSNNIILFAELKTVILQFLPNLERLCSEMQLNFSNKDAFPVLEINIEELTIEESGTSGKDEDSNDHDKEGEDGEEDVKNADDNKGVGGEEKDEDDQRKEDEEEETEDHISNLD
ncbi:hypothetical protein Vadar_004453 [Vaccinium darrowii]|uniref:Uncharacterized protein n=1 Tax=Vaccinium darrowii TaxID=229202 RepID=A0ACB7YJP3_9ERIC|nr:hypothetical protein Vadar_004453 [Vaccinium darrowii]